MDSGLLVGAAAIAGALAVVRPGPVLFVVVIAALVARLGRRSFSRLSLGVAVLAALLSAIRVHRGIARDRAGWERVKLEVPHAERCLLEGSVVTMPTFRGTLSANVEIESLDCGSPRGLSGYRVHLYDLPEGSARSDRVEVVAQLAPSRRVQDPDLGDPRPGWARRGHVLSGSAVVARVTVEGRSPLAVVDRVRARLRRGIATALPPALAPIARAMVLGEEDLAPEDDEAFRRSGLTHLLAVSGSHVALVVGGLVLALQRLLVHVPRIARRIPPPRLASALGVPLALVYEQLAGDSGSARRATAMAVAILVVRAAARTPDIARVLGISVLLTMAFDPFAPFDLSFTLSIAATVGLVALGPPLDRALSRVRPALIRKAAAASLAASISCAPLVAGIGASLPTLSLLSNLVAVPIGELAALPLCNLAAVVGACTEGWPARVTGDAAAGAIVFLRGVARAAAAPAIASTPVPPPTAMQLAVLVAACVAVFLHRRALLFVVASCVLALPLLELLHLRASQPRGVLRVTVLDVGQGDSTLIDLPDGRAMLIDAGGEVGSSWDPGRVVVAPTLAMRRRRALELVVLSHPHPDHFLGLPSALAAVRVSQLWDNGQAHEGLLARLFGELSARGTTIVRPERLCGPPRTIGGASFEVLHPCPSSDPDRGANDNSLVLRIGFGAHKVLLVGDAEHEAERALLASPERLSADFLKVGHHGSRTSSSDAFLEAVHPRWASVSCGARNRFGHPHAVALDRLHAHGIHVLRTDQVGAIRFQTDGRETTIATALDGW